MVVLGLGFGHTGGWNPTKELQRLFLVLPMVCKELDPFDGLGKAGPILGLLDGRQEFVSDRRTRGGYGLV